MTARQLQPQSLYEISLAIGNSLDLRKMVQEALFAYVTRLGCAEATAFEMRMGPGDRVRFLQLVNSPFDSAVGQAGLDLIPTSLTQESLPEFLRSLPAGGGNCSGHFFCLMELPGFGLLLLENCHKPFDASLPESLRELNAKLAGACRACAQHESTEQLNRHLMNDYFQHQRAEAGLKTGLQELETKYRQLFDNAVMGLFQTTAQGRIVNANPSFARILGYSSPEDLIASVTDFSRQIYVNPERRQQLLQQLQAQDNIHDFEIQFCRKDRTVGWMAINARAIRDEDGNVVSLEGTAEDITERKILESRLLQAQKMEAIGTLAGGIAHDFNNILGAIMGFVELTKLGLQEPKLSGYMDQVLLACDRAKNLVRQILTFSRAETQERAPLDLGTIVEEAVKLLQAILPATIDIRTEIAPDLDAILADRTEIHQVLMNLCTNATHAMDEGGGAINIKLVQVEVADDRNIPSLKPGPYLRLSVADTGAGIDPSILERIFDPFFTTKGLGQGTGLGLSVVYGIVKSCGGTILVESDPGAGSTFHVYLPAVMRPRISGFDPPAGFFKEDATAQHAGAEREAGPEPGRPVGTAVPGNCFPEPLGEPPLMVSAGLTILENLQALTEHGGAETPHTELLKIRPDIAGLLRTGFRGSLLEMDPRKPSSEKPRFPAVSPRTARS